MRGIGTGTTPCGGGVNEGAAADVCVADQLDPGERAIGVLAGCGAGETAARGDQAPECHLTSCGGELVEGLGGVGDGFSFCIWF